MRRTDRRSRSKARKPKYLSLRRYLAPPPPLISPAAASPHSPTPPPGERSSSSSSPSSYMSSSSSSPAAAPSAVTNDGDTDRHQQKQQQQQEQQQERLDLLPVYTDTDQLDRDPQVACLLLLDDDPAAGVGSEEPPTLAALLGDAAATDSSGSPPSPASSSMNRDGGCRADGDGLARRALRGRERWVYCRSSSAAASSPSEEEASSGGVDFWWRCPTTAAVAPSLALKLDYEEILTAWSDRGSLYIDGDDGPQVVPQLHHQNADPYYSSAAAAFFPVMVEVGRGAWKPPDSRVEAAAATADGDRAAEGKEAELEISREARVRRYKEKRRSRLFAKRIRYEVRKLNAEKRPRWKGRFIKRKDEEDEVLDSKE